MKTLPSLSIFFPCYNDAKSMPFLIYKAATVAKKVTRDYEIIVVNDGSTDESKEVLQFLQKNIPHLRVIYHKKNKGYGGALISGFKAAKKDWIFYTDGDGQYDPDELTLLVKKLTKTTDAVNGYKLNRADNVLRKFSGFCNNTIIHFFFKIPIRDIDCDFRLMRRSLFNNFSLTSQSGTICTELILKLRNEGARFRDVGVHHYPRIYGQSQFFKVGRILQTVKDSTKLYRELEKNSPKKNVSSTGFEPVTTRL